MNGDHFIPKPRIQTRHAPRVVFRKPSCRGLRVSEDLDVIRVANRLTGVKVDKYAYGRISIFRHGSGPDQQEGTGEKPGPLASGGLEAWPRKLT